MRNGDVKDVTDGSGSPVMDDTILGKAAALYQETPRPNEQYLVS